MLCNVCGKNEATIHLTEILNNQMVELHICETCANEKGVDFKPQFNFSDLLAGLADLGQGGIPGVMKEEHRCPSCGMAFEEFGKTGRLGCAQCYTSFSKSLLPLVKRVQRSNQHIGKRPSHLPEIVKSTVDLKELEERLKKSIQLEEFEEAARIRDEIKQLESKMKRHSKKNH